MLAERMPTIGENIRRIRIAKGFTTQGEFARQLDVPQPRLSDWENGRYQKMDLDSLMLVARVLVVSVEDLLEGVDEHYDAAQKKVNEKKIGRASDLPDHTDMASSALTTAEPAYATHLDAQTRALQQLQQRVAEYQRFARSIEDAAIAITAGVAALSEDEPIIRAQFKGRGHRRKTG